MERSGAPPSGKETRAAARRSPGEDRQVVWLLGLPAPAFRELEAHFDDLVNELHLIALGGEERGRADTDLLRLADRFRLSGLDQRRRELRDQVQAALARGGAVADVEVRLTAAAPAMADDLLAFVDEADGLCRSGRFLTAPASPVALAVLHWIVGEVRHQLAGRRPVPFEVVEA